MLDVGELRNNKVKFKELIVFEDLPSEVCVLIEVFAMVTCGGGGNGGINWPDVTEGRQTVGPQVASCLGFCR